MGVRGGRWYNLTGHDQPGMLASWFILALSSLHYCHTLLYLPLAFYNWQVAYCNGLTNLGDDQMRPDFPGFDKKIMK